MFTVFAVEGYFSLIVEVILLGVKIFAIVACLTYPAEAYTAAGKLTKPAWAIILGLGLVVQIVMVGAGPINIINLAFTIAAFVFLADVRPALAGLRRR
ncbi:tetrahydromethanopterin S-methyltransferase subunit B [Nocardioides ginsengisegetis]|uniref:Tetrahydromethanopterin S-methyltransferase subunit B n=1 Tax=Nocardioides ginsengisegetis TaxID=661491 RepID=A0A7W3P7W9_9ACTN|nr:tetrahydromethanopterin S-methyltransferase subunit B [Nocardioides ginsengisegetis]